MASRFKEERIRINLTKKEMAERLTRISVQSLNWIESPAGDPLKKFKSLNWAEMSMEGMDIQYILTGNRVASLTKEEEYLLDNYRASTAKNKDHLEAVSAALAKSDELNKKTGGDE